MEEVVEKEAPFNWFKQWYIVAIDDFLDDKRPHRLELLGMRLMLWKDGTGKWRCFEDMCPHRLAPLSEGRVESDGNLLCSYHAWRFNGEGKCVAIPQARDEAMFKEITKQPRSCVKSHPCRVEQGAIWVWADSSPTAEEDCKVREPALIHELDSDLPKDWERTQGYWMARDLPYGWDYTHENVMDRAHLAISHHNITGNRYKDAYYMDTAVTLGKTLQEGFKSSLKQTLPKEAVSVTSVFDPPCLWKVTVTFKDGAQDIVCLYSSPKAPGVTRWVGNQFMIRPKGSKSPPSGFAKNPIPIPLWMRHTLISLFIHQDVAFLHYQERFVANMKKGMSLHEKYWMPNPQDKDVIVFRKWFEKAGGEIPYVGYPKGEVPPLMTEERMFDFYESHAKHCRHCQKGLKQCRIARVLSFAAAAFCFTKAMIIAALNPVKNSWIPPKGSIIATVVGLVFLGLCWVINKMISLFFVYVYNHQDNN